MGGSPKKEREIVKNYYDLKGWKKVRGSIFEDAERFEDLRSVVNTYRKNCHLRVNGYLKKGGNFLLDIASGPIQYPEYLSYHEGYKYRICGDISFPALIEAKKIMGDGGFCVQCDITRLPFAPETISGLVSLHTIYHVPEKEQEKAFLELNRVLEPEKTGVVVYSWPNPSLFIRVGMLMVKPANFAKRVIEGVWRRIIKIFINRKQKQNYQIENKKYAKLYMYAHSYDWVQENIKPKINIEIFTWRSISVKLSRAFIYTYLFGNVFLSILYWLEELFPRWFGKNGVYPLIVIKKEI